MNTINAHLISLGLLGIALFVLVLFRKPLGRIIGTGIAIIGAIFSITEIALNSASTQAMKETQILFIGLGVVMMTILFVGNILRYLRRKKNNHR